jgi:site-specific DNA-cytosine methylase
MIAATFGAGGHSNNPLDETLVARGSGYRMDMESETFVVAAPIRASDGHHGWSGGRGDGGDNLITADPISAHEGKTYTHQGKNNFRTHNLIGGVRRLTPLECERLQGFPDGWTDGPADSHRYRMIGNAVATVVAQWLGHRLVQVDELRNR